MIVYFLEAGLYRGSLGRWLHRCSYSCSSLGADQLTELDRNEFKIREIIFDLTPVLGLHVCLLSMLFYNKGFKKISTTGPVLDCPEKLYSLGVLDGKGQQELKLKNE